MNTCGKIHKISVSDIKGSKKQNVESVVLLKNFGIEGDAHAGSERQVSLLPFESFSKLDLNLIEINPGDFAENLTTVGIDFSGIEIGSRLVLGAEIELEITQIGKECHHGCVIRETVGDCIMPREGVFARVLQGGELQVGDPIEKV